MACCKGCAICPRKGECTVRANEEMAKRQAEMEETMGLLAIVAILTPEQRKRLDFLLTVR